MMMFIAGVASVLGLSLLGLLYLLWRAPVMNQPDEALEPIGAPRLTLSDANSANRLPFRPKSL